MRRLLPLLLILAACSKAPASRTVEYIERVRVPAAKKPVRLWLPVPQSDRWQNVELVSLESRQPSRTTQEPEFGNRAIYVEAEAGVPVQVEARYRVTRLEQGSAAGDAELSQEERRRFTTPRGLQVVDDSIRSLADEQAAGASTAREMTRRFYRYVLSFMAYDKDEPGWGRGDPLRACVVGKGNCTDFHSLFQSLAMAKDIPTRFRMGLSLSDEPTQALGRSYHCWAEFHEEGRGWVPVDISEAWKVKAGKKSMASAWVDRYFGALDEDRIALTTGRALRLEPAQDGPPLNYFAYPYVEVGGKPFDGVEFERLVRDVDGRGSDSDPKRRPT